MKNRQFILYLLAAANFTHIMDLMIVMPLGNMLMKHFDIIPREYSWIVSAYAWSAFAAGILGAFYLDKFDRRKAFLFIYLGFVISTVACAFAPNFYLLAIFRGLSGFFGGVVGTIAYVIVSDLFDNQERGSAVGILMTSFSVASVLGVPTGLYFADYFDWHAPFVFISVISFIIYLIAFRVLPPLNKHIPKESRLLDKAPQETKIEGFLKTLQTRNARLALLLMFILVLGQFIMIPFITPYMIRNIGFEQEQVKFIYLLGGGATIFTAPLIGRYTDRIGAWKVFRVILPLSFVAILLLTQYTVNIVWIALVITTVFFIFGSGRMVPTQTMLTMAVGNKRRASFMSLSTAVRQLGVGIASILGGYIVVESNSAGKELLYYDMAGFVAIGISAFALLIAPRLRAVKD